MQRHPFHQADFLRWELSNSTAEFSVDMPRVYYTGLSEFMMKWREKLPNSPTLSDVGKQMNETADIH
jgi:hypothetical protein